LYGEREKACRKTSGVEGKNASRTKTVIEAAVSVEANQNVRHRQIGIQGACAREWSWKTPEYPG